MPVQSGNLRKITLINTLGDRNTSFDSGDSVPGGSVCRDFIAVGSFDGLCLYHPTMTGTVVVTG